ncbi:ParB N-terminal domain-containing protein [Paraburkholderia youngii]|uniref:ParB N-terminal domain-containing protein n=2 Tax=Paraburkholderia youngii TaxID=2782701 RepID=A0A7Y6K0Z0_9BURK|nr:ParB N-terminal domain-containing protein [Paraburkholderia youngii]
MAELRASIELHGIQVPVLVDENGAIIDGHHRRHIADELGIVCPTETREGLGDEEKRTLARTLNTARRHLTREQRRELIAGQLRDTPQQSDRQIAAALGVDHKTVSTQRAGLASTGEIPQLETREGADGKTRKLPVEKSKRLRNDADYEALDALTEFHEREQHIKAVLRRQAEAGRILREIRDKREYRIEGYRKFDVFCRECLDMDADEVSELLALADRYSPEVAA